MAPARLGRYRRSPTRSAVAARAKPPWCLESGGRIVSTRTVRRGEDRRGNHGRAIPHDRTAMIYAVLLRGVNVGGIRKVAMPDLRRVLESLGHTDVATYLQSGNAIVTTDESDPGSLERR